MIIAILLLLLSQKKDLLQLMLEAKDEKGKPGLSAGEILVDGVGVLFAAHKTTGSAIAFAMYLLAAHPEAQEKLADEILDYFEEKPVCRNLCSK